jgi:hypothetical protein
MRKANVILAAVAALGMAGAASAQSFQFEVGPGGVRFGPAWEQRYDHRDDRGISERRAIRIAKRLGMDQVRDVDRNRRTYEITGVDRPNHRMRVVLSRYTGDVLDVDRWRRG